MRHMSACPLELRVILKIIMKYQTEGILTDKQQDYNDAYEDGYKKAVLDYLVLANTTDDLHVALCDALTGWKYIREIYGDLYGVGWEHVQEKLEEQIIASAKRINIGV